MQDQRKYEGLLINELEQHEDILLSIILMYSCGNYFEGIRKITKKKNCPNSFTFIAPLLKNMRS
jgi:hypothetical protein